MLLLLLLLLTGGGEGEAGRGKGSRQAVTTVRQVARWRPNREIVALPGSLRAREGGGGGEGNPRKEVKRRERVLSGMGRGKDDRGWKRMKGFARA